MYSRGEKVSSDLKRTAEYKAKVIEGRRLDDTSRRAGLAAENLAAIKKTVERKAVGFWVEGTPGLRYGSLHMTVFLQAHRFPLSLTTSGVKLPHGLMIGLRRNASGVS